MAPADKTTGKKSYWRTLLCCAPSLAPCMVGQFWGGNQQIAARIVFWRDFYAQQAKASLHRQGLDWIVWREYGLREFSTWKMKNQPGNMKNHENQFGTMKNQPGTMKNHLNPSGTMKNHKNPPGTMINQHRPIKTNLEPWKTMETDLEPWKTNLEPWKP